MNITAMKGFSLIEILMVVAIIALLSAIAIPAYQGYLYESRRADAHASLVHAASLQERYFIFHNKYSKQLSDIGGGKSKEGYYNISIHSSTNDSSFLLIAKPVANTSQANDEECDEMSLDQKGTQKAKNKKGVQKDAECW